MNNIPVPDCIVHFFGKDLPINKTDGKYVCLGFHTKAEFENLNWKSKVLGGAHSTERPEYLFVFVSIFEVIIDVLGDGPRDCLLRGNAKDEVLEYAKKAGIEIPKSYFEKAPKSSKGKEKTKPVRKNSKAELKTEPTKPVKVQDNPIDLHHCKIHSVKEINLEQSIEFKTPSGSRSLVLLPGKYKFALIDSPHKHDKEDDGKVRILWLVLHDYLPVIYGKSVSALQMLLEHSPLS
jgi:hypothetical protein